MAAGGSREPVSPTTPEADGASLPNERVRRPRDFVTDEVPPVLAALFDRAGTAADVDFFVPHQANCVLLGELTERCGLDKAHTHPTVSRYGSASAPVALDDADRLGLLTDGSSRCRSMR